MNSWLRIYGYLDPYTRPRLNKKYIQQSDWAMSFRGRRLARWLKAKVQVSGRRLVGLFQAAEILYRSRTGSVNPFLIHIYHHSSWCIGTPGALHLVCLKSVSLKQVKPWWSLRHQARFCCWANRKNAWLPVVNVGGEEKCRYVVDELGFMSA